MTRPIEQIAADDVAIVIPMLNEAAVTPRLLRLLAVLVPAPAEIIAVDGGSPAKVTCLKRSLYITGSSSTSTRALPPADRGAARFGGGDGSEHLLWRRIRDAAACLAG